MVEIFQKKAGLASSWRGHKTATITGKDGWTESLKKAQCLLMTPDHSAAGGGEREHPLCWLLFSLPRWNIWEKQLTEFVFVHGLEGLFRMAREAQWQNVRQLVISCAQEGSRRGYCWYAIHVFLLWHQGPTHGMGLSAFRAGLPCSPKPFLKHPRRGSQDVFPRWL